MYFWNINGLKEEIINNNLTQKSVFLYILFYTLSFQSGYLLIYLFPSTSSNDLIISIVAVLLAIIGVYYCYRCNEGQNGNSFAERFISLSWVIGIRYTIFWLSLLFVSIVVIGITSVFIKSLETLFDTIIIFIIYISLATYIIVFYYRIGHHIKDINRRIKEKAVT